MPFDYTTRIDQLTPLAPAIALVPGANMFYFTGVQMHLSERPTIALLGSAGRAVVVPLLEVAVWEPTCAALGLQIFSWGDADGYADAFAQASAALNLGDAPLGVDGQTMRVFEYLALQNAGVRHLQDVGQDLLSIRAIKTAPEVDAMRRAIDISEAALNDLMANIKPGMTEREIALELDQLLTERGSQGYAFRALVQSGANSAIPHGHTTDRPLQEGEFLLIDFGGMWQGYPADITRTFCIGTPSDEMNRIYQAVLAANRAAIAMCEPGVSAADVDRAARDVIEFAGYGDYFTHRTGHGLGLEVHEQPNISATSDTILQPGMVFTVEPGIYVPGIGGVRIEDNIHITLTGAEVLTSYPKDAL